MTSAFLSKAVRFKSTHYNKSMALIRRSYHDNIIEHYENPRNVGSLDKNKKTVGTGLVGAPACGDVMKLQFEVDENGKIIDAKFKTFGCGSAIGTAATTKLSRNMMPFQSYF